MRAIRAPVLLIAGSEDKLAPPAAVLSAREVHRPVEQPVAQGGNHLPNLRAHDLPKRGGASLAVAARSIALSAVDLPRLRTTVSTQWGLVDGSLFFKSVI